MSLQPLPDADLAPVPTLDRFSVTASDGGPTHSASPSVRPTSRSRGCRSWAARP